MKIVPVVFEKIKEKEGRLFRFSSKKKKSSAAFKTTESRFFFFFPQSSLFVCWENWAEKDEESNFEVDVFLEVLAIVNLT